MKTRVPALLVAALLLAGCTDNAPASPAGSADALDARKLTVEASDTACTLSAVTAPSGTLTFSVTNTGSQVNEFYLLASDGLRIVAEVENIGPGLTRDLVLSAPAGTYFSACKPGMVGSGIRAGFTVTDSGEPVGPTGDDAALVDAANTAYAAYVGDQVDQLLAGTKEFVAAYTAGDDDKARALYAPTRVHWERIETVAESFGDLDPKMDAREADLEQGQKWTGWHRLEKDLWPARAKGYKPLTTAERKTYADDLLANTEVLHERVQTLTYTVDGIANGAKGLLDEVATGKVTGEEEYWSRTDLWDFQANVDGARVAWEGLRDLLKRKNAALDTQIETRFTELQKLLDATKSGDGFVTYDKLDKAQVKALSDAVNALSEPLSKLAGAVLS
ncbi:MAG: cupredoxin domain-containing protein [Actinobacteria bacterium]|nr:cupredoxin domain-containing protein [Actinomycetota bacterium]